MAQVGIHAILGYNLKYFIPDEKKILPAIIIGAIFPDIDIILVALGSIFYSAPTALKLFHKTITHSFFSIVIIYLFFALISEIYKNKTYRIIGKGLLIGMISHIVLDTFLWFNDFTRI